MLLHVSSTFYTMDASTSVTALSDDTVDKGLPGNSLSSGAIKIDKEDPRARLHYIKYVRKEGSTSKLWECGICGKEFRQQYILLRHIPTHTDERKFKCDYCPKSFRQLSTLTQHRTTHSDGRPFACDVCQKTFARASVLSTHARTHEKEKRFRCEECNKGFHQKSNLRNHMFTHEDSRPYKCEVCGQGFNQKANLVVHQKAQHRDFKPFQQPIERIGEAAATTKVATDDLVIEAVMSDRVADCYQSGKVPLALFKPIEDLPFFVKIMPIGDGRQRLVASDNHDLLTKKNELGENKVPIVATIVQRKESDEQMFFELFEDKDEISTCKALVSEKSTSIKVNAFALNADSTGNKTDSFDKIESELPYGSPLQK